MAQWYVYWEALDNRKGGGCCWNVTTIDKKHGHELPNLDTHTHTHWHKHTHIHTPHFQSHHSKEKKKLTAMHRTRRYHSFYKLFSTWKIHSYTYMREIFFIGTAKAIKCVSLQQQNNNKNKTFCTFHRSLGDQMDWMFTLDLRWEHLLFVAWVKST